MIRPSIAVAAMLLTMPAAAQTMGGPMAAKAPRDPQSEFRLPTGRYDTNEVREIVRNGRRTGTLSRQEARGYRREAGVIDSLRDRYLADGRISDSETRELEMRAAVLRDMVNIQRTRTGAPK